MFYNKFTIDIHQSKLEELGKIVFTTIDDVEFTVIMNPDTGILYNKQQDLMSVVSDLLQRVQDLEQTVAVLKDELQSRK